MLPCFRLSLNLIIILQTIDVTDVSGRIQITTHKSKASPTAVATARSTSSIRSRSGSRRAIGIAAGTAKRGYRPDLRKVSSVPSLHEFFSLLLLHYHSPNALSLEPAGSPSWVMKVGRGHVCNIDPTVQGTDQIPVLISPCRYRKPSSARCGITDSLALTSYIFSLLCLLPIDTNTSSFNRLLLRAHLHSSPPKKSPRLPLRRNQEGRRPSPHDELWMYEPLVNTCFRSVLLSICAMGYDT